MPSAFIDRSTEPTSETLSDVLGPAVGLWREALERVGRAAALSCDWAWSGSRSGWLLRVARKTKPVLYLIPERGTFRAALAMPERVHAAAAWASLPDDVRTLIDEAPSYPEGRTIRFEIRCPADLQLVETLVRTKLEL